MVPEITLMSDKLIEASNYPHQNITAKLLTPKDSGGSILASLTNGSQLFNSRIQFFLYLVSCL